MKKVITVLAILVMVLALAGCSNSDVNTCRECGGFCKLTSHTRVTSGHREAKDYYYYSYECTECGSTFTLVNTK